MSNIVGATGKCVLFGGAVLAMAVPSQAAKFHVLYQFQGGTDASGPIGGLTKDGKLLYGTTYFGGTNNLGTVYALAKDGTESVLHSFGSGSDGADPEAGLVADAKGNLYGTTYNGGTEDRGTVFKITPKGHETVLYSFCPNYPHCTDGFNVGSSLILDSKGNLYGTTYAGGADSLGTVFEVAPDGTETVLYSFKGGDDGADPSAGLIVDASGNFYGTTYDGGASDLGTVFELAANGTESVLYSFKGGSDGENPVASLILDGQGNLYSTTYSGGSSGHGTVFKLAPDGTETVLYTFVGGSDGTSPDSSLAMDKKGNLYSSTLYGGNMTDCGGNGCGTTFKLAPDGTKTILHAFAGSDGAQPSGSLLAGKKGEFIGTTYNGGGSTDSGVIYELKK
ncbi:MAG TPA: choice-of-anchor tandem repeat GloVer-containing protein [Rhizomicrobium sp.]|jgi:uncharacterized repeat protein (TIGR03803 family)|nr:choice-of-anchor tandem repeat GloVer-containing protein [Rhizomicrobium sp.]